MALSDNLEAYWKLDEESGTRVDSAGSNNLTDNNTVLYGTGIISNAADFERDTSEYLSIADNASLSMGDIDFTIVAWIKIETLPSTIPDAYLVLSKDDAANNREYRLTIGSDDKPQFMALDDDVSNGSATWGSALSAATWYFIVGYHDASGNEVGISVDDGTMVTESYAGGVADSTADFEIGCLREGAFTFYFDGLIDEVGVWKRKLTAAEISILYNQGDGLTYPFPQDVLAGPFVAAGTVAKKASRALAGPGVFTGTAVKKAKRALAGPIIFAGTVLGKAKKALAGAITFTGVLAKFKLWIFFARFHDYFLNAPQRFTISSNEVQMTARYRDYNLTGPEKK